MLKKILNLTKKPTNFFLELDEEESNQEANSQNTTTVAPEPVQEEQPQDSSSEVKQTQSKKKAKKAKKTAQQPVAVSQPKPSTQSYDNVEQLIIDAVFAKKVSENGASSQEASTTFATDYLIAKPAPNRRPGASLNKFKEMTRTMKIRK